MTGVAIFYAGAITGSLATLFVLCLLTVAKGTPRDQALDDEAQMRALQRQERNA